MGAGQGGYGNFAPPLPPPRGSRGGPHSVASSRGSSYSAAGPPRMPYGGVPYGYPPNMYYGYPPYAAVSSIVAVYTMHTHLKQSGQCVTLDCMVIFSDGYL